MLVVKEMSSPTTQGTTGSQMQNQDWSVSGAHNDSADDASPTPAQGCSGVGSRGRARCEAGPIRGDDVVLEATEMSAPVF